MMAKLHGPIYRVNMISLFCGDIFSFLTSEAEREPHLLWGSLKFFAISFFHEFFYYFI